MDMPPQQPPNGQQSPPYSQPMYGAPPGYVPPPPPSSPLRPVSQWGPSSIGMDPSVTAGLGYLVSILAIIFFFMEKQNRFVRFHNAQAILLDIAFLVLVSLWFAGFMIVIFASAAATGSDAATSSTIGGLGLILLTLCIGVVVLVYMALWIWGMVAAFSGRVVKFPLVGAIAERWAGGPVVPVLPYTPPPAY